MTGDKPSGAVESRNDSTARLVIPPKEIQFANLAIVFVSLLITC